MYNESLQPVKKKTVIMNKLLIRELNILSSPFVVVILDYVALAFHPKTPCTSLKQE